jgi:AcrR family transcriptional regulator
MSKKTEYEDLREACIAEAVNIIETKGIENLSFREVARRLGVSHQAPYKHFQSRDHILAEIVQRTFQDFAQYLDERPRTGDPERDLESLGRSYLQYALKNPFQYKLMFETPLPEPDDHPRMMEGAQHAFQQLRQIISGMELTTDATHDALFVWSSIHGLASLLEAQAMEKLSLPDEIKAEATRHILDSIKASLLANAQDRSE